MGLLNATRSALRISDVWGNFEDAILGASNRYQTAAVLAGRVYKGFGGVWHGRWSLYSAGRRYDWEYRSTEIADVVRPGIDQTAEMLSIRFAQVYHEEETNVVTLQVRDIRNLADYNRTVDYLAQLSGVEKVQAQFVEAATATFKLKARSGRLGVAQAVSLGHMLVTELPNEPVMPVDPGRVDSRAEPTSQADLIFRLVP